MPDHRLGTGYDLPDDLGSVRGVHRQPRFAGGAVVTEHGTVQSDDFVSGSAGWEIAGDGSVEFNDGVFRGDIVAQSFATGVTPNERVEMNTTNANFINFYTGDPDEAFNAAVLANINPDDHVTATRRMGIAIWGPGTGSATNDHGAIEILAERHDNSSPVEIFLLPHAGGSSGSEYVTVRNTTANTALNGFEVATLGRVNINGNNGLTIANSTAGADIAITSVDAVTVTGPGGIGLVGNTSVTGNLTVSGTFSPSSVSTTTLTVSSNATIGGTLGVTGTTTLGNLTVNGDITANADLHLPFGVIDGGGAGSVTVNDNMGVVGVLDAGAVHTPSLETDTPGTFMVGQSPDGTRWRFWISNAGAFQSALA